ncbi:MAG: Transcription elongation factor GreA [Verrucomicrobia subdivision 3 bacterium]|nr:Transcription elongation factor GreA [Limisphaerales bacterium]MCS1412323.1 Transcription elongation factor GreA [Limisphaerales bacterium]
MREEFEKLAAAGKIQPKQIDALVKLTECGYCTHRSWGFGKITTVDTVFSRFLIDFENKTGHSMDIGFGTNTLKPIPAEHILVRKAKDLQGLRQMAALNHIDLIKLVLQSFDGAATVAQIQEVLVPDVIADDWRKWWDGVRKELKKNGHFRVPIKKSEPILYNAESVSLEERLLNDFRAARGLKARIAVANEMARSHEDLANKTATFKETVDLLNEEIAKHQKNQPALTLDGIFARDDLVELAEIEATSDEVKAATIWTENENVSEILEQLPAARHKRALKSYKDARTEDWTVAILKIINIVSARLAGECANLLIESARLDSLKETLTRLVNQQQASSELLFWLAKSRSDAFADILGPEVVRAMITAMERDQFNEKKSSRLSDYIMSDKKLLIELIETADLEIVKDLTRTLQLSSCFDDMDKRSLLARIVKAYPAVQALISGDQDVQEKGLVVSWSSLERRRNEYDQLVRKKIPANSKEIAIARSYGDLRENHEYKAAKEMQKILMSRKAELETELAMARATDFSEATTNSVSIGTVVNVTDISQQTQEDFTILGAWDSDPDRGIISYLSPMAQELLNHKPGDEITLEQHDGRKFVLNRIEKIPEELSKSLDGTTQEATAESALPEPESPATDLSPENTTTEIQPQNSSN